jgi:hypothetical protein
MEIPNSKFSLSHEALRAGGQIPNKFEVRNWKLSLFIFLFLLFTIYCSLFTRSVSAQQKNCSQFASASCKEYLSGCSGTWAQDAYGYNPADCVNLTNSTSRLYYCCITDPPQSCLNSSGRSCETDCPAACIVNPSSANGWWDCSQSCCNYSCCQTQGGCGATVYCNGAGGTSTAPSSNLPGTCIPSGNSCSGSKIPGAGCRTGYACCMPNNPTATPDPSIPWPTSIPVISPPAGQIAIPPPVVSCGGIAGLNNLGDANNEFHSLRPYQSSVCRSGITNTSLLCGNDLIGVDHTLEVGVDDAGKYLNGAQLGECRYSSSAGPTCGGQPNGSCTPDAGWDGYFDCDFGITLFKRISMAYPDAELPFLGYTQKLPNSQQNTANMGDATKMNEYVSWYLNGTNDRPEATSAVAAATCIGNAIGNYYSEVVDQLPSLSHVKLLSPAFNMTSNLSPTIFTTFYDTIGSHHIDGFAGNLYHAGGKSAVDYYRETWIPLLGNGHLYITEFGNHDSPQDTSPIIGEYTQLAGYGAIQSINLFNALGTHPGFSDFQLSTQKIGDVTGPNRGKGGINSAMPVTYGFADQVNDLGLNPKLTWATQIVSSPSQRGDVASAVNHSNDLNITEILRLCAGNSCDFENPQTLADFIKYLDGHVGGTVYIIVGPNEPDVEGWASKSCGTA